MSDDTTDPAGADERALAPVLPITVRRGSATPEELAALVAVLAAAAPAGADPATARPASRWAARERLVRAPLQAGRGGWRASALPR